MFRVVPSPLGGMWLMDERGVVLASGSNATALRMNMRVAVERRELNPFLFVTDEYGKKVMLKDYLKEQE